MNAANKIKHELKKVEAKIKKYKSDKKLCIFYVFEAMRLEAELEFLEQQPEDDVIEAVCYRRKGNHAYLCFLTIKEGLIVNREFYNPDGYENNERRFKGQSVNCWFKLKGKSDGYYILREGRHTSYKQSFSYLLIEGEEIIEEFDSEKEMLAHASGVNNEEMPELEGSLKQIAWAENIRQECKAYGLPADFSRADCKYWIEKWRNPYQIKRKMYS